MSIVRGCQVNLRNKEGQFISKGWKLMTTNEKPSKLMQLPCTCQPHICRYLQQGMNHGAICWEMKRGYPKIEGFGWGTTCYCHVGEHHQAGLTCSHCAQGFVQGLKNQGHQKIGDETSDGIWDTPEMAAAVGSNGMTGISFIYFMLLRAMDPSKIL